MTVMMCKDSVGRGRVDRGDIEEMHKLVSLLWSKREQEE
jgi:hypothetical protein